MVQIDVVLKAMAASTSLVFGILAFAGGRRKPVHYALGVFFLLIAGNQAAEALRSLANDPAGAHRWFRVATVFAALDPLALLYFAWAYVGAERRGPLLAALAVAGLLAFAAVVLPQQPAPGVKVYEAVLGLFTLVCYTAALLLVAASSGASEKHRRLLVALGVAAIPVWARFGGMLPSVAESLLNGEALSSTSFVSVVVSEYVVLAACAIGSWSILHFAARSREVDAEGTARAFRWGVLLTVALDAGVLNQMTTSQGWTPMLTWTPVVGRGAAAIRWLLFGALASSIMLKGRELEFTLPGRRRAARVVVALWFGTAAAIALATYATLFPAAGSALTSVEAGFLAIAIVASQGFRALVDATAVRLYGVPRPGDPRAAAELYQLAVEEAVREGRVIASDDRLRRLRADLDLDRRAAEWIEETATKAPMRLGVGDEVLGRFVVRARLGQGAHGDVVVAHDTRLDRPVVLKLIRPDGAAEAIAKEARLVARLRHPNIVGLYDAIPAHDRVVLVQEFVPGGDLEERVRRKGRLDLSEGVKLLDGVLAALCAAHAAGIVHRDVKPANIVLDLDGSPKVSDFGVARAPEDATIDLDARIVGTPAFMAPEQRRGGAVTAAADVYALSLVARACLTEDAWSRVGGLFEDALQEDPLLRPASDELRRRLGMLQLQ